MPHLTNRISDYFDESETNASDSTASVQCNNARCYDPTTGCWMNEEPIGFAADADLNRYPGNSPE